ncbi:glycosyltransferase family 4 protein [Photobacterium leiognathi]|uniref:glycosyltransferase family 4 protein n=1 Tax=Photobacterium leiognathi TaxID=553611 RepID=UPI0029820E2D|nr:glycosyltransferase family 4 protein [Photobacterium leiognathi]
MKKVLFIINVDWYFNLHWLDRAVFLKEHNYDVHILMSKTDSKVFETLSQLGFTVKSITLHRKSINPFKDLLYVRELYRNIKNINPDIIHAITIKPNIYSGIINKLFFKRPIIYSITGLGAVFSSASFKFKFLRLIIIFLYRFISFKSSYFIFENETDMRLFVKYKVISNNGVVIKGAGVNTDTYYFSELNYNSNILFAARLLKDKGLEPLIKAVENLRSKGIKCQLNVAGIIDEDVSSAIPLKEIDNLDRKGIIKWLGTVTDMASLIHKNDIVCLPTSYGEGVPRILIESASCGRPIISTDVAGCNEIIIDGVNGYLVNVGDVNELTFKLESLLSNPKLMKEQGIQGRLLVQKEFSQNIVLTKTYQIYKKLLK